MSNNKDRAIALLNENAVLKTKIYKVKNSVENNGIQNWVPPS